ncbi:MAG: hypothetical protein HYS27_14380 [Deltaproteobacteria bacterium]|nr:hypothetical protein [Deltaproteobacteria bacterium]
MYAVSNQPDAIRLAGRSYAAGEACLVQEIGLDGTMGASASLPVRCMAGALDAAGGVFIARGPASVELPGGTLTLSSSQRALIRLPLQGPAVAALLLYEDEPFQIAVTATGVVALASWNGDTTVTTYAQGNTGRGIVATGAPVTRLGSGDELLTAVTRNAAGEARLIAIDAATATTRWSAALPPGTSPYDTYPSSSIDGVRVCGNRADGDTSEGFVQLRDLVTGSVLREQATPAEVLACSLGDEGSTWTIGSDVLARLDPDPAQFELLTAQEHTEAAFIAQLAGDLLVVATVNATADRLPPLEPGRIGGTPGTWTTLVARVPPQQLRTDDGLAPMHQADGFARDGASWIASSETWPMSIEVEPASGDIIVTKAGPRWCDIDRLSEDGSSLLHRRFEVAQSIYPSCKGAAIESSTFVAVGSHNAVALDVTVDGQVVQLPAGSHLLLALDDAAVEVGRVQLQASTVSLTADGDALLVFDGGFQWDPPQLRRFGPGLVDLGAVEIAMTRLLAFSGFEPGVPRVISLQGGDALVVTPALYWTIDVTFDDDSVASVPGEGSLAFRVAPDGRMRWVVAFPGHNGSMDPPRVKDAAVDQAAATAELCGGTLGGEVIDGRSGAAVATLVGPAYAGFCLELDLANGSVRALHQPAGTSEVTAVAFLAGEPIVVINDGSYHNLTLRRLHDGIDLPRLLVGSALPPRSVLVAGPADRYLLLGAFAAAHADASAIVPGFELPGVAGYYDGFVTRIDASWLSP